MPNKELPMISCKRLPLSLPGEENESCLDNSACCEAENTLARLFGDRSIARERCLHVCAQVKNIEEDELIAEIKVFKAVADATRLKILRLLTGGELCACEIMLALKRPQSSISHNLSLLEDAGLVKERKEGKWCRYRISDEAVIDMISLAGQFKRK
jgi:ArsR family transcriptional regulator